MTCATARARRDDLDAPKKNKTGTFRPGVHPRLVELGEDRCRYPIGRATGRLQRFCGAATVAGPYCPHCAPQTRIAGSAMRADEIAYWAAVAEGRR